MAGLLAPIWPTAIAFAKPPAKKCKSSPLSPEAIPTISWPGRKGIFYDRKGRDWDATITKIVDNPISIRQAFWSPYKKLVRAIEEQIAKRAAAADATSSDKLAQAAANMSRADLIAEKNKAAEQKKVDVGNVAAMGVAVGAIGGAAASLATGILRLPVWQIPLVFVGLILLISLPSMIIATLKLRKRNLGPILDANGWAVKTGPHERSLRRFSHSSRHFAARCSLRSNN